MMPSELSRMLEASRDWRGVRWWGRRDLESKSRMRGNRQPPPVRRAAGQVRSSPTLSTLSIGMPPVEAIRARIRDLPLPYQKAVPPTRTTAMPITRSKSTPHVSGGALNGIHPHEPHPPRPQLPRSRSVLGSHHREVTSPTIAYSPSVEREDPFNLSNFFPSLNFGERDDEWKWLQEETSHAERSPARSGYSTPYAEEDAWLPRTPPEEMRGELVDEALTEAAIQHEDKLGILTFGMLCRYSLIENARR